VLWWLLLYLAITYGVTVAGLAIAGRLDAFGSWAIYPALLSGGLFGGRLYERRKSLRHAENVAFKGKAGHQQLS
jgi:hypothetical protein